LPRFDACLAALPRHKKHLDIGLAKFPCLPERNQMRLTALQPRHCPELEMCGQRVNQFHQRSRRRGAYRAVVALHDDVTGNTHLRLADSAHDRFGRLDSQTAPQPIGGRGKALQRLVINARLIDAGKAHHPPDNGRA